MSAQNGPPPPIPIDNCVSVASILRCYTHDHSNLHHALLIIPVALELIFSTSLIFTNWGSGRRHLLLVAEGWTIFLLSLLEAIFPFISAVRDHMKILGAIDQTIGALSFTQLFFYMAFLYALIRGDVLPSVPARVRRISQPLLLIFIPAVIAMNAVASFAGISYVQKPDAFMLKFNNDKDHFVWTFFTSITLALLCAFQASCFVFAFYRLIRAFLAQRKIESDSKDAAVMFRGIGWINAGIKLGAIETVVGFVYLGITVAYVRRVLRLLSRALLCIGVVKGIDGTEDFNQIRDELESPRRSKIRNFISNPRQSTFRQLSPNATAFYNMPRGPQGSELGGFGTSEKRHPYANKTLFPETPTRGVYAQSPIGDLKALDSPRKLANSKGYTAIQDFTRTQPLSRRSTDRVTVHYNHGTPELHLRLSVLDMPSPAVIVDNVKSRPMSELVEEYRKSVGSRTPASRARTLGAQEGWFSTSESNPTPGNAAHSRFSAASRESIDVPVTAYPASTTPGHGPSRGQELYRYGANPYGYLSSPSSPFSGGLPAHDDEDYAPTSAAHGHSPAGGEKIPSLLDSPSPPFLGTQNARFSGYSSSGYSAVSAEIVDTPRRKLSFTRQKSALARAVLYPVPPTKVAMALTESIPAQKRSHRRQHSRDSSLPSAQKIEYPSLPSAQRPSPPPSRQSPVPTSAPLRPRPQSRQIQPRESFVRQSVVDEDGNVIMVTAIAPSIDEDYDLYSPSTASRKSQDRSTRALSGYSVRSVPETIQAVRELARKFPGPPPGAVVADIGFRAPTNLSAVTEESLSRSGSSLGNGSSNGHETSAEPTIEASTDTDEVIRRRIPAETKLKGKQLTEAPTGPLPPIPQRQQQKAALEKQAVAAGLKPIDPFDDDDATSYRGSELSPLSMSVKLRHPRSFMSNAYAPSTRRNSGMTTATTATTFSLYSQNTGHGVAQLRARGGQASPGILDFGTALKEWNSTSDPVTLHFGRPIGDFSNLAMVDGRSYKMGHRRSISAKTQAEVEKEDRRSQMQTLPQEVVLDELTDQANQLRQTKPEKPAPSARIKSIGKAPRRITPTPMRGRYVRGSMHLQPLVIPSHPSRDVPMSAVGAGGISVISAVNAVGMNVQIVQDDTEFAVTSATESNPRGIGRDSEVLSLEGGGYVPIRLQGRKGSL